MTNEVYKDTVGLRIRVDTGIDLSTATLLALKVKNPDGELLTWTGVMYATQYIDYVTVGTELSNVGTYKLQAYVEFGTLSKHRGRTATIEVYDVFEAEIG